jgi:hypothetical protein
MQRFTVVLIGLILLIFTFQANAESPFIYGIHDLDSNPQEYDALPPIYGIHDLDSNPQEYDALPPNSAIVNGGFEGADDGSGVG